MFRSALLRLTLWYLLIIMTISIGFSVALYNVSVKEINQGFGRQSDFINQMPMFGSRDNQALNSFRTQQLDETSGNLSTNLWYLNLAVLALGGIISYLLAQRTLKPIEDSIQAQNRFTADASHELRTPLTSMKTEIEVNLRDENLSLAEAKEMLKSNLEEVERLEILSRSLLKLAGQNNALDPRLKTNCNLAALVEQAVEKVVVKANEKQIKITTELESGSIRGDKHSLVELLIILLDNAIKYSKAGQPILVRAYMDEKHPIFEVHDKGMGIKESDLPHIFDRFYRADHSRSKQVVEGYGLGLSIAKRIVEMHKGQIKVNSKIGEGSTFIVTF